MTGPSDEAVRAAVDAAGTLSYETDRRKAVERAYPIIRADVIAEVVEALRTGIDKGERWPRGADFIEHELTPASSGGGPE